MAKATLDRTGRCLCGEVTYRAQLAKPEMDVCHCSICRRWSGGVFMAVPCDDVQISGGPAVGSFRSSDWAERLFCKTCGSSLVWRLRGGGFLAVSMQSLDDASGLIFAEEIFIDEKPKLYDFVGTRVRKTGAQVLADAAAKAKGKGAGA